MTDQRGTKLLFTLRDKNEKVVKKKSSWVQVKY